MPRSGACTAGGAQNAVPAAGAGTQADLAVDPARRASQGAVLARAGRLWLASVLAAASLYRPACLEQHWIEHLRSGDAHRVIGVHLVDRGVRDRLGQLKLAAGRQNAVPGRDHHRGGDIDLADPAGRVELADGLEGRDGGGERGPAQLGAGPASCGRVINGAQ